MFHHKKSLWLFLLPGLAGLTVFYLAPFLGGIYYSLTDGSIANRFVGLDNYRRIWQNEVFRLGLKNTLELSLLCTPGIFVLSFILAVMLKALREKSAFFRNVLLLPYLMPSSALLIVWLLLFDYGGPINRLLEAAGRKRGFLISGGDVDTERMAKILLDEFRGGKLGRFTLELPE